MDSSSLIQLINDRTDPLWFLWNIIYCILNLLILFEKVRFALFEKRESIIRPIGYGTWLDKKGMNDFFFFFLREMFPDELSDLLTSDDRGDDCTRILN